MERIIGVILIFLVLEAVSAAIVWEKGKGFPWKGVLWVNGMVTVFFFVCSLF